MEQLSKICLKLITIIVLSLSKSSQRYFYCICHLSPCGGLLERSHFNRRSEQLIGLVQIIWQALNAQMSPDKIVIMDRFPFPHCQHILLNRLLLIRVPNLRTLSQLESVDVCVAHPDASCKRGRIENFNWLLREFVPKG